MSIKSFEVWCHCITEQTVSQEKHHKESSRSISSKGLVFEWYWLWHCILAWIKLIFVINAHWGYHRMINFLICRYSLHFIPIMMHSNVEISSLLSVVMVLVIFRAFLKFLQTFAKKMNNYRRILYCLMFWSFPQHPGNQFLTKRSQFYTSSRPSTLSAFSISPKRHKKEGCWSNSPTYFQALPLWSHL